MPSDPEIDLAKTLSDLKEELRDGFASLKRELSEQHESAVKRLRSKASSTPKFKKKSNEKQFEVNAQVLDKFTRPPHSFDLLHRKLKEPLMN